MDDNIELSTEAFLKQKSLLPDQTINNVTFHGEAGEYFFIWLKNLFLCLLTLGLYIPWAMVNRQRYFFNATEINHTRFEYHAKPSEIFFSYLLAGLLFIITMVSAGISVTLFTILVCTALLLMPYFLIKIWCFNVRNTGFNGCRFDYKCDYMKLYWVTLILPVLLLICIVIANSVFSALYAKSISGVRIDDIFGMLIILSIIPFFGIILIWSVQGKQLFELLINYLSYGKTAFSVRLQYKPVIIISLIGGAIIVPFVIAAFLQFNDMMQLMMIPERIRTEDIRLLVFKKVALFYLFTLCGAIISATYVRLSCGKYVINSMTLGNLHFRSDITFLPYLFIMFTNVLIVIVTLGLGTPYAHIRHARYMAQHIRVIGDMDSISDINKSEIQADRSRYDNVIISVD